MINLGDTVKDPITGYTGIAVERVKFLQGCDRIGIQAPVVIKKGEVPVVPDLYFVDIVQLKVIKQCGIKAVKAKKKDPGGRSTMGKSHR